MDTRINCNKNVDMFEIIENFLKKPNLKEENSKCIEINDKEYKLDELDVCFLNDILEGILNSESKIDLEIKEELIKEIKIIVKEISYDVNEVLKLPITDKNKKCFEEMRKNIQKNNDLSVQALIDVLLTKSFNDRILNG